MWKLLLLGFLLSCAHVEPQVEKKVYQVDDHTSVTVEEWTPLPKEEVKSSAQATVTIAPAVHELPAFCNEQPKHPDMSLWPEARDIKPTDTITMSSYRFNELQQQVRDVTRWMDEFYLYCRVGAPTPTSDERDTPLMPEVPTLVLPGGAPPFDW